MTRWLSIVIVAFAIQLCGCGEGEKPVDLRPADTSQFDGMKEDMTKNLKGVTKGASTKP